MTNGTSTRRHLPGAALAGITILVGVAVLFRPDGLSVDRAVLATLVVMIGLLPTAVHLWRPQATRSDLPLTPFVGLFYAVFFGFPVFLADQLRGVPGYQRWTPTEGIEFYTNAYIRDIEPGALTLLVVGLILLFGCWFIAARAYPKSGPVFGLPADYAPSRPQTLLWVLALGNLAYIVFPQIRALPSVGQFLQPVGIIAMGMFFLLTCRRELPWWQAAAYFLVLVPVWLAYQFGSGFLTTMIYSASFLFVVFLYHYRRIPLLLIAGVALSVLLLAASYPVLTSLRTFVWEKDAKLSIVDQILLVPDAVLWAYKKGSKDYKESVKHQRENKAYEKSTSVYLADPGIDDPGLEETPAWKEQTPAFTGLIRRISLVLPLSHVVSMTPESVPYWRGETYKPFFTSWIPRVFWSGKPREVAGNAFGRRYAILPEDETGTSVNFPWVTEMYANFGTAGVIVGMSLAGLLLGLLQQFFVGSGRTPLEFVVGSGLIFPLFYQESNFSLMTGSLLPLAVCLWLYFRFGLGGLRRNRSRPGREAEEEDGIGP